MARITSVLSVASCKTIFSLFFVCVLTAPGLAAEPAQPSPDPPPIPLGLDAFTQWERWPYLRIGVRSYMRSTFDRTGGNNNADAAHFIRQLDDTHNVVLDESGPGILWFVRHNHWHGSPWQYLVDGRETIVTETSTADPLHPVHTIVQAAIGASRFARHTLLRQLLPIRFRQKRHQHDSDKKQSAERRE